jgi:hypothetical protein
MSTKNEPGKLDPYPGNLKRHDVERRDAHVTDPEWSLNVEAVNHAHEKTLRESCEAALASRDATIAELRSEVERYRKALESIVEYWNKDRNDGAMHDACWHNVNTAADALDHK